MDPNVLHEVRICAKQSEVCREMVRSGDARIANEVFQGVAV